MHFGLKSHPRHSEWLANSGLVINDVFLRQHVQYFLVRGDGDSLCSIDDAIDVLLENFLISDGNNAMGIH